MIANPMLNDGHGRYGAGRRAGDWRIQWQGRRTATGNDTFIPAWIPAGL